MHINNFGKIEIISTTFAFAALSFFVFGGKVNAVLSSPDNRAAGEVKNEDEDLIAEQEVFNDEEVIVKFKGDREPFRIFKSQKGRVREKLKEYIGREDVEYAEPNYIAHALMLPNDTYYGRQWNLYNPVYGGIQMEKAWDVSQGATSVVVAVIDTGIAYENYGAYCQAPDLAQTIFVQGYDFVNNDAHPNDDDNHGTHVAGTIAQSTNNNLGVAGIAFRTSLMPIKVLDGKGSGTYANVARGIRYAADHGAKVINLSLGGGSDSQAIRDAVAYAFNKGVTIVAACGNGNASNCNYPAAYDDYVIAVGATQYDQKKAPYSNYGSSLDLMAPGGNTGVDQNGDGYGDGIIQQTFFSGANVCGFGYYFKQGTSMAAPHVSGVAALLMAKGNATTPDEIRTALQTTAEDLGAAGRDNVYGYGLVDAAKALQWSSAPAPIPSPTPTPTTTEIVAFEDGFEAGEWNGLWAEDSQNDWFRSTQRAVAGGYSAEVDGLASDAALTSIPINLQGRTNATITFSWFIESGLDLGEYLAFDVSTDNGASWIQKAQLRGNVDAENVWNNVSVDLTGINNLKIRFRGKMSLASEDADVDEVLVLAR